MRPDITYMRTEALQNPVLGRYSKGKDLCLSSEGGDNHSGNEASLTEKGNPTIVQGCGAWCKQVSSQCWR